MTNSYLVKNILNAQEIGQYIINKYRYRPDMGAAARALRKQGYPLEMALKILLGK